MNQPERYTVHVTQEHIDEAREKSSQRAGYYVCADCAVAKAAQDVTEYPTEVSDNAIFVRFNPEHAEETQYRCTEPYRMISYTRDFDAERPVKPTTFEFVRFER